MMSTRRARGVGALAAAAVLTAIVAALMAGGAGAGSQSALALPRAQTLYMSGNQWSPNVDLNPAKNWDYVTGLVGFAYETPFRYDPLEGQVHPVARVVRQVDVEDDLLHGRPQGREVERRADDDAAGREVQLRHPQDPDASTARALAGHRTEEHQGAGLERRLHVRRQPRHTSSSTSTASTSRSCRSTCSRATRRPRSRPET